MRCSGFTWMHCTLRRQTAGVAEATLRIVESERSVQTREDGVRMNQWFRKHCFEKLLALRCPSPARSFIMVNPQESKPQAQRNWLIYCKGGRTMSTKWTFVHVVLLRYDEPYEKIRELLKKYLTSSRQMRIIYFVSQRGGFPRCGGCGNSSVVEHHLAKVGVASSSLVFRSIQLAGFYGVWAYSSVG